MTGFRIALKNIRFKEDPTGRVRIYRVHRLDASKRKRIHAQAKREAAKWIEAAEHYTPIPKETKR